MKKVIIIIGVILITVITCFVLTFNLFGCSSELPQLVSQNVIIYSESMTEYDEFGGLNSLRDTAIYELREHYDIDYYKYDPAIGFYTILKTDTGILLLTFDWTLKFSGGYILNVNTDINAYNKLDNLQIGTPLEDVMEIDSKACCLFLFAGNTKYPKFSYHCFSNGNAYAIWYDDNYCVSKIYEFTI